MRKRAFFPGIPVKMWKNGIKKGIVLFFQKILLLEVTTKFGGNVPNLKIMYTKLAFRAELETKKVVVLIAQVLK